MDREECSSFKTMTDILDEQAKKYRTNKYVREHIDSKFAKRIKQNIHDGEWCRVDTTGEFEYKGHRYKVDVSAAQYQPVETEFGLLYDMDRILVTDNGFYDMNYDSVSAYKI